MAGRGVAERFTSTGMRWPAASITKSTSLHASTREAFDEDAVRSVDEIARALHRREDGCREATIATAKVP